MSANTDLAMLDELVWANYSRHKVMGPVTANGTTVGGAFSWKTARLNRWSGE